VTIELIAKLWCDY